MLIPSTIKPGSYTLNIVADYGKNQESESAVDFVVVERSTSTQPSNNNKTPISSSPNPPSEPGVMTPNANQNKTITFGESLQTVKNQAKNNPDAALSICAKFTAQDQKDVCYTTIAEESGKNSYCELVKVSDYKDNCYLFFIIKGDTTVCGKIIDPGTRAYCNQLDLVERMNEAYKRNDTQEVLRLSNLFEPKIYNSNPQLPTYTELYGKESTLSIGQANIILNQDNTQKILQ